MAIAFDNIAITGTQGSALSLTLTVTSGAVLVVCTSNSSGFSVSAIAYGGVALAKLGFTNTSTELWGLTAPAAGANTLSMEAEGTSAGWTLAALSYTGVKDSGPFGTPGSATGTAATNVNLSVSATTGAVVVGFFRISGTNAFTANNGTTRGSAVAGTSGAVSHLMAVDIDGAASITLSATAGASTWQMIGLALYASADAARAVCSMTLTGAGF